MPVPLPAQDCVDRVLDAALDEDIGCGDATSESVIPAETRFSGVMSAREPLVVAGLPIAAQVFERLSDGIVWTARVEEGATVARGAMLATVEGPARALLTGERTALNLLQHLSGIATLTRAYVDAMGNTGAVLLDTRKTVPGLRRLAKYATRVGGARNHRMGLFDAILIKDNHVAVCGGIAAAVARAKSAWDGPLEVECDTLDQVREAVAAGADTVLLDNMDPATLREAVAVVAGRAKTEASGGVTLDTIGIIAATGVDFVSVGRITQSAPAVDIGLDWTALA